MKTFRILSSMRLLILIVAFAIALDCRYGTPGKEISTTQPGNASGKNDLDSIGQKEVQSQTKETDQLGTLVSTIDFKLKATEEESKNFEDGIVPWINLEDPAEEAGRLIDGDRIVVPYEKVTFVIDYPLNNPASIDTVAPSHRGFSRKSLVEEISRIYREIYMEEEKTATIKTTPRAQRKGLINRNETNGKYGIWGHDLSDLALSIVKVYKSAEGKLLLSLVIES